MPTSHLIKVFITVLLLPFFGPLFGQDYTSEIKKIENSLTKNIQVKAQPAKQHSIPERMAHFKVPGVSIAVVKGGELRWAKAYGQANTATGRKVDLHTLFQAGSISKPVAALAVLKLMEMGQVDLDTDVNQYLKSWKIPDSPFLKNEKVTLRRLLTHTAGMTVHGFPGYKQSDDFPSDIDVLNGKGNTDAIFVDTIPGAIWRYSGGGYTVMERVVEDVSDMSFQDFMDKKVLRPLDMSHSTYAQPLSKSFHEKTSAAYDGDGQLIEGLWHNYPEQAAAGLWTTPTDLAKYCMAMQSIAAGESDGLLQPETVAKMLTKHKNDWGLGPGLAWEADSLRFQHGGKNAGFTNNMVAFANRGDAVIVMTSGDNGWPLIQEIQRAISDFYGWGLGEPKIIDPIRFDKEDLKKWVGKYKLNYEVPGIGDYFVEIKIEDEQFIVIDENDGGDVIMTPLENNTFIDINKGDQAVFQENKEGEIFFLWNNNFHFEKVE